MQVRKIISEEERERVKRRNARAISIILAAIMLFSSLGYFATDIFGTKAVSVTYNGLKFTQTDYQTWTFSAGGKDFETKFNPEQTKKISSILSKNLQAYYNKPLYFGTDSISDISSLGNSEITKGLSQFIIKAQLSCITANCAEDNPIKNCSSDNVIIFKRSSLNITRINEENGCVVIEYAPGNDELAADAFLFKIFGIN